MALAMSKAEANAMTKGQSLAAQVERRQHGIYTVPSQTEPGVRWTVVDREVFHKGHGLECTCPAGMVGKPCAHKAAVLVRRQREAKQRPAAPAPVASTVRRVALV